MGITGICDLLRGELLDNGYEYGFLLDGERCVPDPGGGFDPGFARLLTTAYRVQEPAVTLREKLGTCIDAVVVMRALLGERGVPSRIWLMYDQEKKKPHTVLTFEAEGKTVYLELTPRSTKPWYGRELVYPGEQAFLSAWRDKGFEVTEITDDVRPGRRPEFMFR